MSEANNIILSAAKISFRIYTDTNKRGCANGANDLTAYAVNDVMLRINDVACSVAGERFGGNNCIIE